MDIEKVIRWIAEHKDALTLLCGVGLLPALFEAIYKFIPRLLTVIRWFIKAWRERERGVPESPFKVFPPGSNLLPEVMPDPRNTPLSDYNIPYVERVPGRSVRREMEDLLRERGALLVLGKSGIGKTREAVHLAQMLNNEGWTVLYLPPDARLDVPSRPLPGVPARKLLVFLDNLNVHCYRARREVNPRADSLAMPLHEPFQKRLLRTLEALETFYGRGEILVLATARNEKVPEQEEEPAEWDKLEWARYPDLWGRFARYEVPEPDPEVAARLLETLGKAANVPVEGAETIARRNDGTLRNLVENLDMAANPERGRPALTPETFRDTLRGTWAERYRRALARYPEAKYLYWAAALLRRYGFPLERRTVLPLARDLLPGWNPWVRWVRLPRALRDLERREALYTPRDGQLEAAGPPEVDEPVVVRSLIRLGKQYRLADALHNLAVRLMWPEGLPSPVHHPYALHILQKITTWQLENPVAWYDLGVAYALVGHYNQAIKAFRRAIALDHEFAAPWNGLGNVYRDVGRYEEAIRAYQRAIDLDPKDAAPWNGLGNIYYDLGHHDKAIEAYQQAIALDPNDAIPRNNLGNIYRSVSQYDEAIQNYQQAIALDPKFAAPWNGLGNVYRELGRYDEAIQAYQKAIALDPKSAYPWNGLGNVYADLGRYEEAIQAYRRAITLDLKLAAPLYGLGNVYALCGKWEQALEAFRRAVELEPEDGMYHASVANALRALGREAEAQEEIARARPFMEKESEYNRACFAAICGDKEEALRLLEIALQKRQVSRQWARRDPDLRSLHGDPRFEALVGAG
jgi:tetratricopeptide (TPR) repeat protein